MLEKEEGEGILLDDVVVSIHVCVVLLVREFYRSPIFQSFFLRYQTFVNSYEPDRVIAEDEYNEIFAKVFFFIFFYSLL